MALREALERRIKEMEKDFLEKEFVKAQKEKVCEGWCEVRAIFAGNIEERLIVRSDGSDLAYHVDWKRKHLEKYYPPHEFPFDGLL